MIYCVLLPILIHIFMEQCSASELWNLEKLFVERKKVREREYDGENVRENKKDSFAWIYPGQ